MGCTVPQLVRYCEGLLCGRRRLGILPSPRPVAEPWKITQPASKGATLLTSCSTVSRWDASCSLRPADSCSHGNSFPPGRTNRPGLSVRTATLSLVCTLSGNRPCESRNDQSPHCPLQWRLMACPGYLETMSTGLVAPQTVFFIGNLLPTDNCFTLRVWWEEAAGAQDHLSHLSPFHSPRATALIRGALSTSRDFAKMTVQAT